MVSIIIACYNDQNVEVAIKSAYNQIYPNKEIIVVDDGSSKGIKKLLHSLDSYIDILITQNNKGQSIARNNGIKKATGEYILNLDSDDYFEPKFIEKAIVQFKDDSDVKIVTCQARRFNTNGTIDIYTPPGGNLSNFLFQNSALGSAMFRRKDWEEIGGYEEDLPILGFEDWEFYINLLKKGGHCAVLPEVLFHYQVRENSTTAKIKGLKNEKFKIIIFKHSTIYKDNFEMLIEFLCGRLDKENAINNRILTSREYRLGNSIFSPFRLIKRLLKF